jgi:hypothetical protein
MTGVNIIFGTYGQNKHEFSGILKPHQKRVRYGFETLFFVRIDRKIQTIPNSTSLFAEVHEFVECANCEGKILVRSLDLASHFRQHHNRSCLPAPNLSASSPVAGSSSAAKRQRAEAHSPVEATCAVDILDLTEGEFAIPDKYSRDPLGRMEKYNTWKYNFSNYCI